MEAKHRKVLIICAVIFFGSYAVRGVGNFFAYRAYQRQQAAIAERKKAAEEARKKAAEAKEAEKAKKKAEEPAPSAVVAPPEVRPPEPDPVFIHLRGRWLGRGVVLAKSNAPCSLRFELDNDLKAPDKYSGYFNLTCGGPPRQRHDPQEATLKGSPENGSLKLAVDKVIGISSQGCVITSVTVTPFGTNMIDVAWTEDKCGGGHVVSRRMGA